MWSQAPHQQRCDAFGRFAQGCKAHEGLLCKPVAGADELHHVPGLAQSDLVVQEPAGPRTEREHRRQTCHGSVGESCLKFCPQPANGQSLPVRQIGGKNNRFEEGRRRFLLGVEGSWWRVWCGSVPSSAQGR